MVLVSWADFDDVYFKYTFTPDFSTALGAYDIQLSVGDGVVSKTETFTLTIVGNSPPYYSAA